MKRRLLIGLVVVLAGLTVWGFVSLTFLRTNDDHDFYGIARINDQAFVVSCGRAGITEAEIRARKGDGGFGEVLMTVRPSDGVPPGNYLGLGPDVAGTVREGPESQLPSETIYLSAIRTSQTSNQLSSVLIFNPDDVQEGTVLIRDDQVLSYADFGSRYPDCRLPSL